MQLSKFQRAHTHTKDTKINHVLFPKHDMFWLLIYHQSMWRKNCSGTHYKPV